MNHKKYSFPNLTWIVLAVIIIFGITALFVIKWSNMSRGNLPVLGTLPEFEFTERSGVNFGLENMRGKINVVDFFFSNCHGPCPIMAGYMNSLYQLYESSDRIQFVSISVDPERDSLMRLQEYAHEVGVIDFRWLFLNAPIEDVVELSEKGFMIAAEDLPGNHSTKFVLVDHLGQIRGYYSGIDESSMKLLIEHIRVLGKELP